MGVVVVEDRTVARGLLGRTNIHPGRAGATTSHDTVPNVSVSVWTSRDCKALTGHGAHDMRRVIDKMGIASQKAQGLRRAVTSWSSFVNSDAARLYLIAERDNDSSSRSSGCDGAGGCGGGGGGTRSGGGGGNVAVIGLLKMGVKHLFVHDTHAQLIEINPPCALDFYVSETHQRRGFGKQLFDFMLRREGVVPRDIAYEAPSKKFRGFLRRHFGLCSYIEQNNKFVLFDEYFRSRNSARGSSRTSRRSVPRPPSSGRLTTKKGSNLQLHVSHRSSTHHGSQQHRQDSSLQPHAHSSASPHEPKDDRLHGNARRTRQFNQHCSRDDFARSQHTSPPYTVEPERFERNFGCRSTEAANSESVSRGLDPRHDVHPSHCLTRDAQEERKIKNRHETKNSFHSETGRKLSGRFSLDSNDIDQRTHSLPRLDRSSLSPEVSNIGGHTGHQRGARRSQSLTSSWMTTSQADYRVPTPFARTRYANPHHARHRSSPWTSSRRM